MTSYRKTMREAREEMLVISEAKYELYHKDFSTAMQHAYKMAKKLHGITVDPKEIDDKVASGPSKPSEGKTNSYRLEGDKGAIQIQVYNKGGSKPFELNFYKEEVELDEKMSSAQISQLKKAFEPMRGKKISMKHGEKLRGILDKVGDDKEVLLSLLKANIPFVSRGAATRLISKHDMKGAEINKLMASYNVEESDLDEGKMSQLHQHIKDGKSAKEIAKIMKLDVKTIQSLMDEKIVESELDENLDGRTKSYKQHRERLESLRVKRQEARDIDPADIDTSATDDDIKSANKNILMQLRKSVSLRGQHPVEFLDKKKIKIPQKIAQAALTKYISLKKPMDKEKFQSKIAKSHRDLLMALKESNEKMGTFDEVKNLMRKFREGRITMGKKYLETKKNTLESSIIGVWEDAAKLNEYKTKLGERKRVSGGDGRRTENKKLKGVEVTEGSKEEYEKFFNAAMKKFNINSPADLKSDEEKKKFFNYVDKNYTGEKNEEVEIDEEITEEETALFELDDEEFDEAMKKKSAGERKAAKKKRDKYMKTAAGKASAKKAKKRAAKVRSGAIKVDPAKSRAAKKRAKLYSGDELDEGTKQVLAHGGKGKYKVTKDGDTIEIKFGGKVVGTADFDRGADSFFVSIKGEKGQKSFDDAQAIADYFAKNKITEEDELEKQHEMRMYDMKDAVRKVWEASDREKIENKREKSVKAKPGKTMTGDDMSEIEINPEIKG
jgi:hypothetical protein